MKAMVFEQLSQSNLDDAIDLLANVDARHFPHITRRSASNFLKASADVHLLGRIEGRAVSFGMLRGWQEGFEVPSLGLAVRSGEEGRGYGRSMMAALEGLARDRGVSQIRLRVHPDHARARRLYEHCGYTLRGVERGEILMVLDLAARNQ